MNSVNLIGRLTREPEVRYTQSQTVVARFTLAVDRRYNKDGEKATDFIPVVAFGKTAEFAERWLRKGERVAVTGEIQTRSWEKDGKRMQATEVAAGSIYFADGKKEGAGGGGFAGPMATEDGDGDDLPF